MAKKKIKVTLQRSWIGTTKRQQGTLRALGLRKIRQSAEFDDTPVVRGMIDHVRHLVQVEE